MLYDFVYHPTHPGMRDSPHAQSQIAVDAFLGVLSGAGDARRSSLACGALPQLPRANHRFYRPFANLATVEVFDSHNRAD